MKIIAVDFDGVIHSFTTPWTNVLEINDPIVPGAAEWLTMLTKYYKVILHTCRLSWKPGEEYHEDVLISDRIIKIKQFLASNNVSMTVIEKLEFHTTPGKPYANIYVDDHGYRFTGEFPSNETLDELKPWNRQ